VISTLLDYVTCNRPFQGRESGRSGSKRKRTAGISVALLVLVACRPGAPAPAEDPWIPDAADVEFITILHYALDARGDVVSVGGATQMDPKDNPRILTLLSSPSGEYFPDVKRHSAHSCSIAIDGAGKMLAIVRAGTDWIDVLDDHHKASDGYTLIARSRTLDVREQIAFAQLCELGSAEQMQLPIQ
jgi:hypothetical protein